MKIHALTKTPTQKVLEEIELERLAQDEKWGEQDHKNGTDLAFRARANEARNICNFNAKNGTVSWRDILTEEFFEAMAEVDEKKLREELVQVAAVCVNWVEALDRKNNLGGI